MSASHKPTVPLTPPLKKPTEKPGYKKPLGLLETPFLFSAGQDRGSLSGLTINLLGLWSSCPFFPFKHSLFSKIVWKFFLAILQSKTSLQKHWFQCLILQGTNTYYVENISCSVFRKISFPLGQWCLFQYILSCTHSNSSFFFLIYCCFLILKIISNGLISLNGKIDAENCSTYSKARLCQHCLCADLHIICWYKGLI